jgi:phosphate uptake regulator
VKRRIIKQGKDSFTLTLPKSWINNLSLKSGDEIELTEEKGLLVIGAKKGLFESKKSFDADKVGDLLVHYVCALYRGGVDEIEISFSEAGTIEKLQKILSDYIIGFEIVEQGKNFCVVKSISMPLDDEFGTIFHGFLLQITAMAKNIAIAIKSKDIAYLKDTKKLEIPINRFSIYCRRILNKKGACAFENAISIYALIELFEMIADHYKHLCSYFLEFNGKMETVSSKTQNHLQHLFELIESNYLLFFKFSEEKAMSFWKKRQEVLKETMELFKSSNETDTRVLAYTMSILELLTHAFYLKLTSEVKPVFFEEKNK